MCYFWLTIHVNFEILHVQYMDACLYSTLFSIFYKGNPVIISRYVEKINFV